MTSPRRNAFMAVPTSPPVHLPVKVWQDEESWYAEVVTVPQAHVCAASREDALAAIRDVVADLRAQGLLQETAELASVEA